jgi:hypothetical protein
MGKEGGEEKRRGGEEERRRGGEEERRRGAELERITLLWSKTRGEEECRTGE